MIVLFFLWFFFLTSLLLAEKKENPVAIVVFKMLTASCFLLLPWLHSSWSSAVSITFYVALVLCWVGDAFLAIRTTRTLLVGLVSFLCAHIVFVVAFFQRGLSLPTFGIFFLLFGALGWFVWKHFQPYLKESFQMAVPVYAFVIVCMVSSAIASCYLYPNLLLLLSALSFFLSDFFVAKQRFVQKNFANKLVGLPLYFVAQMLFAWVI